MAFGQHDIYYVVKYNWSCTIPEPFLQKGFRVRMPKRVSSGKTTTAGKDGAEGARTQGVRKPLNDLPHHTTRIADIQKIGTIGVPHSGQNAEMGLFCARKRANFAGPPAAFLERKNTRAAGVSVFPL